MREICVSINIFPFAEIRWTKLYQKGSKSKNAERTLMVRPCFPTVHRESQMPDVNTISEVVVIVNDVWKVGDLVDWWTDNCFWSGRITEKLGDEKVKVMCFTYALMILKRAWVWPVFLIL